MPGSEFKSFELSLHSVHSFCSTKQFLYERNLQEEQTFNNLKEEIHLAESACFMGISQLFVQVKVFQLLLLTKDDLRTRNKYVWFQSLQQYLPNSQYRLMTHTLPTLEFLSQSRGSLVCYGRRCRGKPSGDLHYCMSSRPLLSVDNQDSFLLVFQYRCTW